MAHPDDTPQPDLHLQSALRHAPDAQQQAPAALSQAILDAARTRAAQPSLQPAAAPARPRPAARPWWRRLGEIAWLQPSRGWATGLAAMFVVVMAGLIWIPDRPDADFMPPRPAAPAQEGAGHQAAPPRPTALPAPAAPMPGHDAAPTTRQADQPAPARSKAPATTAAPKPARAHEPAPTPAPAATPPVVAQPSLDATPPARSALPRLPGTAAQPEADDRSKQDRLAKSADAGWPPQEAARSPRPVDAAQAPAAPPPAAVPPQAPAARQEAEAAPLAEATRNAVAESKAAPQTQAARARREAAAGALPQAEKKAELRGHFAPQPPSAASPVLALRLRLAPSHRASGAPADTHALADGLGGEMTWQVPQGTSRGAAAQAAAWLGRLDAAARNWKPGQPPTQDWSLSWQADGRLQGRLLLADGHAWWRDADGIWWQADIPPATAADLLREARLLLAAD